MSKTIVTLKDEIGFMISDLRGILRRYDERVPSETREALHTAMISLEDAEDSLRSTEHGWNIALETEHTTANEMKGGSSYGNT